MMGCKNMYGMLDEWTDGQTRQMDNGLVDIWNMNGLI